MSAATPLEQALAYAASGLPVFPCHSGGECRKQPLVKGGFYAASRDAAVIAAWWSCWPQALIGMPTGPASGRNVLDIDVKTDNGFDTLEELGFAILPVTPLAHTPTLGLHLHFETSGPEIRNTVAARGAGLGPGVDWRGRGGYVVLPSSGSGYWWDPICGPETPLAPVPDALRPRTSRSGRAGRPVEPSVGLSPYAEAALDSACRNIRTAGNGRQEATLNGEAFSIGQLVGARAMPRAFARDVLVWAALQMPNYKRPWTENEIKRKVDGAFAAGELQPRRMPHA
jgi:Bifunctional DNA primase/polymerase, N-terminal